MRDRVPLGLEQRPGRSHGVQPSELAVPRLHHAQHQFEQAAAREDEATRSFKPEMLPFDHPLWVVYSSGTTGLPKPIAERFQAEVKKALEDPEITAKLEEVGILPIGGTPDEMTRMLRTTTDDMTKLARQIGIEPN